MALTKTQISELYVAIFNRASEGDGNSFWQKTGLDSSATADEMLATSDAQAYFGDSLASNQDFIEHIYLNTLNKTVEDDAEGISYWVDLLDNGATRGEVVVGLVEAVASYADSTDPVTKAAHDQFMNRVEVSDYMADTVSAAPSDYETSTSFGGDLVVTDDATTVTDSIYAINDIASKDTITADNYFTLARNVNETVTEVTTQSTVWGDADCVDCSISLADFNTMVASVTGIQIAEVGEADIDATAALVNVNLQQDAPLSDGTNAVLAYEYVTAAGEQFTSELAIAQEHIAFLKGLIYYTDPVTGEELSRFHSTENTAEVTSYDLTQVVLTTEQNNGGTIETGKTTSGDDVIVAGQAELIHGAYIDAGAGNNTLEIDMKGVYAQPLAILNVQTIKVENLTNVYSSFYDLDSNDDTVPVFLDPVTTAARAADAAAALAAATAALGAATDPTTIALLTEEVRNATLADIAAKEAVAEAGATVNPNSILDLTRAVDLDNLVVTEGFSTDVGDLGSLTIIGVRGDATTTLEGSFNQAVNLQYSEGLTDGINLVLNLGQVAPAAVLSIAHNAATLNIDSIGGGNVLPAANLGSATLLDLNVSGDAVLYISTSLNGAFQTGHPANITTTNTAGVDLTLNGFADEVIFTGTTDADNHFNADANNKSVVITDGNGNNEFSAQDGISSTITSGNGNNEIITDDTVTSSITTGTGMDMISSVGSTTATVTTAGGNNNINVNTSTTVNVTAGEGNDTISAVNLVSSGSATIDAGNGDNMVIVSAQNINVTTGTGNDTIVLSDNTNGVQGNTALNDALITVDAGSGSNTILLGTDYPVMTGTFAVPALAVLPGITALEGSTITGSDITLKVNATSDLSQATLNGITAVVMEDASVLTLTQAQFTTLGAAAFDVEQDAFTNAAVINVIVSDDATLSDMVTLADLVPSIDLSFTITDGASLTLSAEELHTYVAVNGINVDDSLVNGYINNQVTITDASLTFDAFNQQNGGNGAGTIDTITGTNDVTIIRSEDGYNRPEEDGLDNTWTIDSDVTPVIDAIAADGTNLTDIDASAVTTLKVVGAADLNFVDSVTLGNDFVVDFSATTGTVTGLTISNFEDINAFDFANGGLPLDDEDTWGSITGNGIAGTRVNLEFSEANQTVGYDNNDTGGFKSTGVDAYVVTAISGAANTIWVCDQTDGVKTLGLQGNNGDTITFGNVNWSTTILAQGDGYADWTNLPKVLGNPDSSNVGSIVANYFTDGAQAIVNVNNAGVALGVTSTGTVRGLEVDSITVNNANTITINVEDGNAVINAVSGDSVNSLVVTSAFDVTIQDTIDNLAELEAIDASGVTGTFTLELSDAAGVNDLSQVALSGIDAIVYSDAAALTISVDQALAANISTVVEVPAIASTLNLVDLGIQAIDMTAIDVDNIGTVTIVDSATTVVLDSATVLGNGVTSVDSVEISALTSATTVEMTAAQYDQIAGNGTFTVDAGTDAATGLDFVSTLRITDIAEDSDINLTDVNAAVEKTLVLNDTVASDTIVVADKLTITADPAEYVTLEVTGGANDLTNAVIVADISEVVFTADSTLTLTAAQINAIQADYVAAGGLPTTSAFSVLNGAVVTLDVIELDGLAIDLGLIEDAGINIGTVTTTDADVALHADTTLGSADSLVVLSDASDADHTLTLSAAQYKELKDGTITESDTDATVANKMNVLVTDLMDITTVVVNAQGLDENVATIDMTNVTVTGTQVAQIADNASDGDVTFDAASLLAGFSIQLFEQGVLANGLEGQTVRFNNALQAEREIIVDNGSLAETFGSNVVWLFDTITDTVTAGKIDTAKYDTGLDRVWMLDDLVDGANVEELFTTINENIIIRVVTVDNLLGLTSGYDRTLEIESFVSLASGLTFSDIDGATAPFDFVENLTIDMGGATNVGDIVIDNVIAASVNNDDEFQILTLNSILANVDTHYLLPEHFDHTINPLPSELADATDQANTVGNISSGAERDVLSDVTINTNDAFAAPIVGTAMNIGTITFTEDGEELADDTATLTINGTSDVTIASLNTDDADIQNLVVTNTNAAILTITGASPAAAVSNTETLTVNSTDAAGTITFGTAGDADKPGVFGPALSAITTAGAGDIDLGVIADIDGTIDAVLSPNGFVFTGGSTGDITFTLGGGATVGAPELGATEAMTFNFVAGATVAMTIASDFAVNAGGVLNITNADALTIDGAVNLSVLGEDLNIVGSAIVVPADSTLTLTAEQADALTITGAGSVVITELEVTPNADLSSIMTTAGDTGTVTAALDTSDDADADTDPENIALGDIGIAHVTVTGDGSVTSVLNMAGADRILGAVADADEITRPSFTIESNATLNILAAQTGVYIDGTAADTWSVAIDGAGDVNVADLGLNPASLTANLSGITTTGAINAVVATSSIFTGDLGTAIVSVNTATNLTAVGTVLDGVTIIDTITDPATTGAGTITVANNSGTTAQDINLSNATVTNIAFAAATVLGTVTFPALRDGDATTTPVTSAQTVTLTTAQANGQTIAGAADGADADAFIGGVINVTNDDAGLGSAAFDLSGLTSGLTTVTLSTTNTLNAATNLGNASTVSAITIVTIPAAATVTMLGSQASGMTMTGAGALILNEVGAGIDLSNVTTASVTANVSDGAVDLSSVAGLTAIDIVDPAPDASTVDLKITVDQFTELAVGNSVAVDVSYTNSIIVDAQYTIPGESTPNDVDMTYITSTDIISGSAAGFVSAATTANADFNTFLLTVTVINQEGLGSILAASSGANGHATVVDNFIYSTATAYATVITTFDSIDGDKVDLSVFNDTDNSIVEIVGGGVNIAADDTVLYTKAAAANYVNEAGVLADLNGAVATLGTVATENATFVVAYGDQSRVYEFTDVNADDTIDNGELVLIGTVDDTLLLTDIVA